MNVHPRVITGGSSFLELNGLLLSDSPLISVSTMVLDFPSAASVGAYSGIDSPEYAAAEVYFNSYNNKFTAPKSFLVVRRVSENVPAWLRGAKNAKTLAQFQALTDGALSIRIDNTAHTLGSDISFAGAASFSDVAQMLESRLPEGKATVSYSSLNGTFTITSKSIGENSTVSLAPIPVPAPTWPPSWDCGSRMERFSPGG